MPPLLLLSITQNTQYIWAKLNWRGEDAYSACSSAVKAIIGLPYYDVEPLITLTTWSWVSTGNTIIHLFSSRVLTERTKIPLPPQAWYLGNNRIIMPKRLCMLCLYSLYCCLTAKMTSSFSRVFRARILKWFHIWFSRVEWLTRAKRKKEKKTFLVLSYTIKIVLLLFHFGHEKIF